MARFSIEKGLAIVVTAMVIGAIVAALFLVGGPNTARALRFDALRAQDMNDLANALNCYWTLEEESGLPADLETLAARIDAASREHALPAFCQPRSINDPETGDVYRYRPLGGNQFEICAIFARESDDTADFVPYDAPYDDTHREFRHDAGEHCFQLTAETVDLTGGDENR